VSPKYNSEVLPENRVHRLAILLKNLPSEDLVHIQDRKVPAFLRIDKDVMNGRERLHELHDEYMSFDTAELHSEVKQNLVNRIQEASVEFDAHH
jgi:hypothetical protein